MTQAHTLERLVETTSPFDEALFTLVADVVPDVTDAIGNLGLAIDDDAHPFTPDDLFHFRKELRQIRDSIGEIVARMTQHDGKPAEERRRLTMAFNAKARAGAISLGQEVPCIPKS